MWGRIHFKKQQATGTDICVYGLLSFVKYFNQPFANTAYFYHSGDTVFLACCFLCRIFSLGSACFNVWIPSLKTGPEREVLSCVYETSVSCVFFFFKLLGCGLVYHDSWDWSTWGTGTGKTGQGILWEQLTRKMCE